MRMCMVFGGGEYEDNGTRWVSTFTRVVSNGEEDLWVSTLGRKKDTETQCLWHGLLSQHPDTPGPYKICLHWVVPRPTERHRGYIGTLETMSLLPSITIQQAI